MRAYAQAESGGAIDSNVYGIRADLDMDNAVVAGQLFGAYVNVDAESASTLNGSALAVGRTLLAILENFYENGLGVHIPKVLADYLDFDLIEEQK